MATRNCPECGSNERRYHCHDGCSASTHIVDCLKCKTPYTTTVHPKDAAPK